MVSIRNETLDDYDSIRSVTVAAFNSSEFGHNGEADLIDSLRATDFVSLVACADQEIVGHILFTPVTIKTSHRETVGMGLAPMSVLPDRQKMGIGSRLVSSGLKQLFENGCEFVVVLGHAEYYSRLGFQPASQFDVSHGFEGLPQDVFFLQFNPNVKFEVTAGARAYYSSHFGQQHCGE